MATYTFSEFHLDEAEALLDLEGARTDLRAARDYVDHLLGTFTNNPKNDYLAVEALCVTAIIKYGRAFVGGVRKIDKKALTSNLPPEIEVAHQNFINWRNLHIAHSVNDFEMAKIQARYCAERVNEEGITSISVAHSRVVTPGVGELEALRNTIDFFLGRLGVLIEDEEKRLLVFIRNLPLEQVLKMDEPATVPGSDRRRATISRKRK